MSGAILAIVAMCLPWTPGDSEIGWNIPMVLLFSPLFFVSAPLLAAAIAIGVVCGRVTRNDPYLVVSAKSTELANTFAILGVAVLGLRSIGLVVNLVRGGVEGTSIGAYVFLIASSLAIVGVFGAIYKRY